MSAEQLLIEKQMSLRRLIALLVSYFVSNELHCINTHSVSRRLMQFVETCYVLQLASFTNRCWSLRLLLYLFLMQLKLIASTHCVFLWFLSYFYVSQRADVRWYWYNNSVCPSVRHVPVTYRNGFTYRHNFFTTRYPNHSSLWLSKFFAKFR